MNESGVIGILHPETHFTDPKAGPLRAVTYPRLRRHFQFSNELTIFEEVNNKNFFGINIYGRPRDIRFDNMSNVQDPDLVDASISHDGFGSIPGVQHPWGGWDLRPHRSRVMSLDEGTLETWSRLFDEPGTPANQARLLRPITSGHLDVLRIIAEQRSRMSGMKYRWSSGWNETGAKESGFIAWRTAYPPAWSEAILQGPHFTVATPFARQPNDPCRSNKDYASWDLEELGEAVVPRTNYQRACDRERYDAGLDHWDGHPYTHYWRVAWRNMTQPGLERSLHASLVPPGAVHVHTVYSLALQSNRLTAQVAGLWASLPFDYMVKIIGMNVNKDIVDRFPAPFSHPAAPFLLLRALRLNCLTRDYAPLWAELFEAGFAQDAWTPAFAHRPALGDVGPEWTMGTPLRAEFDRRAALVEIDALTALMLGLTADQLCLMYRAQFAVLRKYEYGMFFDAAGRKVAKDHHAAGVRQGKEDYALVSAWHADPGSVTLPDLYVPPFTKPDREAELRAAYAEFARRLGLDPEAGVGS